MRLIVAGKLLLACGFFLCTCNPLAGQGLSGTNPIEQTEAAGRPMAKVEGALQPWLDSLTVEMTRSVPSRAILMVTGPDGTSYYAGFDGRLKMPVETFDQTIEFGSCSKIFTATAILQLVESGKFSLEDRLVDLMPDDGMYSDLLVVDSTDYIGEVRVKHLLNHTSGIPDYFMEEDALEIAVHGDSTLRFRPRQLIGMANRLYPGYFPPGTQFKYSNSNYILLGMLIEKYGGVAYQNYIQRYILDPAGMEDTFFASRHSPADRLSGHFNGLRSEIPATMAWSAGEMLSTLDDMSRFMRFWLRGRPFRDAGTLESLKTEAYNNMGMPGLDYGLGLVRLHGSFGHAGQTFGFQSYMGILPNGWSLAMAVDDAAASIWLPAIALVDKLGGAE